MTFQPELALKMPAEKAPAVTQADIDWLIKSLEGRDWTTAADLCASTGRSDRDIRAIARQARPAIVSFPGSKGYKLWSACTVAEHLQCMRAIRSQMDDMRESYLVYFRAYHAGGPKP